MLEERGLRVSFLVSFFLILCVLGCDGNGGSSRGNGGSSGTINAETFSVDYGDTESVTEDLTIVASKTVDISGTLAASGAAGQNITIQAEGDVVINGTVQAGNGADVGQAGGTVTIISNSGNITITDTAHITAGDGGAGQNTVTTASTMSDGSTVKKSALTGEKGGNGGSVILKAPKGTIYIANKEGVIHIGNGGNGSVIDVQGEDLLTNDLADELSNSGGRSGWFLIDAAVIDGLSIENKTLEYDMLNPDTNQVIIPKGTALSYVTSSFQFSGGKGGDGGSVYYGMDRNGNSTWPTDSVEGTSTILKKSLIKKMNGSIKYGAGGGDGWLEGGKGADINFQGKDVYGKVQYGWGGNANVNGGDGGDCGDWKQMEPKSPEELSNMMSFKDCKPGRGGNAVAKGGKAPDGPDPNGAGGTGGGAEAVGGNGGKNYYYINPYMPIDSDYKGIGGDASAYGGDAGNSGGKCPDNVVDFGGNGGMGGSASARGGKGLPKGKEFARGGNGGNGGPGIVEGGDKGWGGQPFVTDSNNADSAFGTDGNPGTLCPVVPLPTTPTPTPPPSGIPSITEIPGTYTLSGTKTSETCPMGYPSTIGNPSVPFSTSGNNVTVHSSADITGYYNSTDGSFSGAGIAGDLKEIFVGQFSNANDIVQLTGDLTFNYISGPYSGCSAIYNATYKKN